MDAFEHGKIVADFELRGLRAAFCLYDYEPDERSYLFTVVANASFNAVRFFSCLDEALHWLRPIKWVADSRYELALAPQRRPASRSAAISNPGVRRMRSAASKCP